MLYWNERTSGQTDAYSVVQMSNSEENVTSVSNSQTDSSIQSGQTCGSLDDDGIYSSSNFSEENESSRITDGNKAVSTSKKSFVGSDSSFEDTDSRSHRSTKWSLKECVDLQKAVKMYGTHDHWSEIAARKRGIVE